MASILPYLPQKVPQPQKTYPQVNTSYIFNPASASSVSSSSSLPSSHLPLKASLASSKDSNPCSMDSQPYLPQSKFRSPSSDTSSMNQIFKSLFGSEVTEWPYSEDTLQRAIHLRISQEKTKQEYYRVERLNRVIELMKLAAIAKVPGHLIPCLFESHDSAPTQKNSFHERPMSPPTSSASPVSPSPSPSPVKASRYKHARGHTISKMTDLRQETDRGFFGGSREQNRRAEDSQSSTNSNSMRNFRFGLGSAYKGSSSSPSQLQRKRTTLPPKHQLSPSRIGAHAISSLHTRGGRNVSVDLQSLRHGSSHNRTLSLPASVSIPETESVEFGSSGHAVESRGNSFKEITIPYLTPKKDYHAAHDSGLIMDGGRATDSEEEQDVEKLLDCSDQANSSFLKRRKLVNGSPLKNMTLITDETENTTITENDGNGSIVDLSIANTSTFSCSSPIRPSRIESQTS